MPAGRLFMPGVHGVALQAACRGPAAADDSGGCSIRPASSSIVRPVAPRCAATICRARASQLGAVLRLGEAARDKRGQFVAVADDHRRLGRQQQGHHVAKIVRCGAKADGGAVSGRLDHVLSATRRQAAADKGDRGRSPPGPQFADPIDQQNPCVGVGRGPPRGRCAGARRARSRRATAPRARTARDAGGRGSASTGEIARRSGETRPRPVVPRAPACCRPGRPRRRARSRPTCPAARSRHSGGRPRRRRT